LFGGIICELLSVRAMRMARFLSANSTQPSVKLFFLLPPDLTRFVRTEFSSACRGKCTRSKVEHQARSRLQGRRQWGRRWAGARAPPQPLLGIQAV